MKKLVEKLSYFGLGDYTVRTKFCNEITNH